MTSFFRSRSWSRTLPISKPKLRSRPVLVSEKFCGLGFGLGRVGLDYNPGFYMLILVPLHFWLVPPHFICSGNGTTSCPAPRGAFRSRAFPNKNCAPLSGDCVPKKVTGPVPMECSSRLETPKILIITPEFVSKNRSFADSSMKTFFFVCWSSLTNSRERSFCASQKNDLCLPSHATLAPDIQISQFVCSPSWND